MDFYKNLPAPARIAIPVVLVLMIAFLAMQMTKAPPPVEIIRTQDVNVFDVAKNLLEAKGIAVDETREEGDIFILSVPEDSSTEASQALLSSGIRDNTGIAKKITCPAAPGFTATKAANERANNCANAATVQRMLLTAGAIAANVSVSQEENGTLLGPEKSMNVVAQVFLPKHMKGRWNAEQAASAISGAVGTSIDRVTITDDALQSLFDGSKGGSKGSDGPDSGSSLAVGCGDIGSATEVETKKAAVRACYKETIGDELTRLLGGSDRFVLTVEPSIDSKARTTTSSRNTKGPVVDRSSQQGSGSSVVDESTPPNTTDSVTMDPAGDVTSLRLSVTLDKATVGSDQVLAVRRVLQTHIDPRRGDPTPLVTLSKFANGAGSKATNETIENVRREASGGMAPPPTGKTIVKTEMPKWLMAVAAVLVIALLTTIAVLWQRSTAMAAERRRLEESFKSDQRLFENFAQQNPDQLAQEMNALFGAPSAPGRTG